jgi:hypothetical protein
MNDNSILKIKISAITSIILKSPNYISPSSAMIVAYGWMTQPKFKKESFTLSKCNFAVYFFYLAVLIFHYFKLLFTLHYKINFGKILYKINSTHLFLEKAFDGTEDPDLCEFWSIVTFS